MLWDLHEHLRGEFLHCLRVHLGAAQTEKVDGDEVQRRVDDFSDHKAGAWGVGERVLGGGWWVARWNVVVSGDACWWPW